jgi:hypothetical protein
VTQLEIKSVLLSKTEANNKGAEGVYAAVRNDYAKDESGKPIYGKQYSYQMFGTQLHGPIPEDIRGGFTSFEEAEQAAHREYKEWRAGNIPTGTQMARHVYWRTQYRNDRYLEYLSADEIAQRTNDVMNNLMTLTEDLKIGIRSMDEAGNYWSATFTHILEECALREYAYPFPMDQIKEPHQPDYDWPGVDKAIAAFKARGVKPGEYLVKYGEYRYLQPALEQGQIRVFPASRYDDPSLNYAIRDSELELKIHLRPNTEKNEVLEQLSNDLKTPVEAVGDVTKVLSAPTNYYVYCMAAEFDLRLFGDFKADSCLLITKPIVFIDRLFRAVGEKLPDWRRGGIGVKYIDPVNTTEEEIDLHYCKDFSYAYQKEYRLIWTPPVPETALKFIDVELESLEDCCELIYLKD